MVMTEISDEIWATLDDLTPSNVEGYVAAEPVNEAEYGASHKLHGLFDTIEAAHEWANASGTEIDAIWVVWQP